jgi:hypothetical protein
MFVRLVTESLPFSEERYQQIVKWQEKDPVCQQPKQYCLKGWPAGNRVTISRERLQPKETLIPTDLPKLTWDKVAMDLFSWKGNSYLLQID